jgi:hypothetical protein
VRNVQCFPGCESTAGGLSDMPTLLVIISETSESRCERLTDLLVFVLIVVLYFCFTGRGQIVRDSYSDFLRQLETV